VLIMAETGNVKLNSTGDSTPQHMPGAYHIDQGSGAIFRYVKYLDGETAVTAAAGLGVFGIQENRYHVTADFNSTTTNCNTVLGKHKGYLQAVVSDGQWGWIQTSGPSRQAVTLTAATTSAGCAVVAAQGGNGTVTAAAFATTTSYTQVGKIERATVAATTVVAAGTFIIDCEDQW
jgi:hypothetical protein